MIFNDIFCVCVKAVNTQLEPTRVLRLDNLNQLPFDISHFPQEFRTSISDQEPTLFVELCHDVRSNGEEEEPQVRVLCAAHS